MTNQINYTAAMKAALEYAKLNNEEIIDRHALLENGYYDICIRTVFMAYEFFVDALTGEVAGFNSEPVMPAASCEALKKVG